MKNRPTVIDNGFRYVDVGDDIRVLVRPECACVFESARTTAGEPLSGGSLPRDACYLFGSERSGLSDAMLARATHTVRIPMRDGVSSLNLATAVAIVLYALPGAGEAH